MKKFKSPYDFYELDEEARKKLCGTSLIIGNDIFFVVQLSTKQPNYGCSQGLILLNKPESLVKSKKKQKYQDSDWFNIYCYSPDDLDCTLDLSGKQLYYDVKKFMQKFDFSGFTYRQIILKLQETFGGETYFDGFCVE
jgi:hypothetical protein